MIHQPLFLPLAALIAGISAARVFSYSIPEIIFPILFLPLFFSLFNARSIFSIVALSILLFVWGNNSILPYERPRLSLENVARNIGEDPIVVTAVIDCRPENRNPGTRLSLAVETIEDVKGIRKASGKMMLYVGTGKVSLVSGDRVRFSSRLKEPRNYGIPGEYDLRRSLALRGIYVAGYIRDSTELENLGASGLYDFSRAIDGIANLLGQFIDKSVAAREGGILKALLLGDRGSVPPEIESLYARTGVNHILSISGFHISIIAITIYQLLYLIIRRSDFILHYNIRRYLMFISLVPVGFYLILSGSAPATIRSVLMLSACFFALLIERESDSRNALILAALLILVFKPQAIYDLSFQLSFIAFWGLLVLSPILLKSFARIENKLLKTSINFAAVSIAAIAATLIPVAYTFHRVSVVGLLSNIVVIPLLGYGAVVAGFTGIALYPLIPNISEMLLKTAAIFVRFSNFMMIRIDSIPQLPRFTPSFLDLCLSMLILIILTVTTARWMKRTVLLVIFSVFMIEQIHEFNKSSIDIRVTFLSVGQGESTLIRFPDKSTMLIDGGGSLFDNRYDVGERLLAPALWNLGVKRIDRLVLSHPHPDHLKGLLFIADNFEIGEFWRSSFSSDQPEYLELIHKLSLKSVPIKLVDADVQPFSSGEALVEPLAPFRSNFNYEDINDESMVFRISQGKFSMLFTGDSGFITEAELLKKKKYIASVILKVAHHGSRHSSSLPFIKAIHPLFALISAGYDNSFNLPADETVKDLLDSGATLLRTDLDGTVSLSINPSTGSISVSKMSPLTLTPDNFVQ